MPILTAKQNKARVNDDVQSVLVSREFKLEDLEDIMDLIGYNYWYVDPTKNYWRIRQFNPGSFREDPQYKTVASKTFYGIKFIVEY